MKQSLSLVTVIVCISVIQASPISRKAHAVTEPLGFLTNFILNKRARAVSADQPVSLQNDGATKRSSVIPDTPFVAAASIRIRVKADQASRENKSNGNQLQNEDAKTFVDSSDSGSSSTTEAFHWSWWQLSNKKSSEKCAKLKPVGHRDIIKLSFRNETNISTRASGTALVDAARVEVDDTSVVDAIPIESVEVDVIDTILQDNMNALAGASATSMDGSIVSMATSVAAKTKKQEASVKIVANPKLRILYEDNSPNFTVTLQVIQVEIDPVHLETVPYADAVDVKPADVTSAVDSSSAIGVASTSKTSIIGAEAVNFSPVVANSGITGPEETPIQEITFDSVFSNLPSGGYVYQSIPVTAGVIGVVGETEAAKANALAKGTGLIGDEGSAAESKKETEESKSEGAETESDSVEEEED